MQTTHKVHDLMAYDMPEAYDFTQYGPILDGHIMRTRDGWAVMVEAWPVMVDAPSQVFHQPAPNFHKETKNKYRTQWDAIKNNPDQLAALAVPHENLNP